MLRRHLVLTIFGMPIIILAGFWTWHKYPFDNKNLTGQSHSVEAQAFILPISQTNYLPIRNFNIEEPDIQAKAAGLYDVRSERFLYSKNINQKMPVASITKLMTAIVIMENLPLNETYSVAAEDINVDGTGADLQKGEKIRGSDLLKMMLIKSSNDAALSFGRSASEKNINLVAKMNDKAKMLNMTNTKFNDPAGLNDGESFSTTDDLVKLVRYVNKYPVIWEILMTKTANISSVDGSITHHLVSTNRLLDEVNGVIGGKTGYTDGALETMAMEVTANEGSDRLISIILGSQDRFAETKKLIDWGRSAYRWK